MVKACATDEDARLALKTVIEKNAFGNNPVSLAARHISIESTTVTKDDVRNGSTKPSSIDIVEINVPNSANHLINPTYGVLQQEQGLLHSANLCEKCSLRSMKAIRNLRK
ncbi:hypothetical protein L1987_50661 [Smallanthus sonchifolius]|uniref:Uncharacterized protein n=1 Tax=Smallanthus sonchifolius TaxID=185202 RepID=A0ACB9EMI5_9ASTR|nr:hypothetical protein L1987_50661 [Smallanthus sonchifolius]